MVCLVCANQRNRKGELRISSDKIIIKTRVNLNNQNDSGRAQYIGTKHKIIIE